MQWAGGGLNLYTYLTYTTSTVDQPGCNGDTSCNAGFLAGVHAYNAANAAGAGSTSIPWWLDVENNSPSIGAWSGSTAENAMFVQGALNALHETEGIADVGIYASPGVWNNIVGNYAPSVPYWMADYLSSPSGPGSCADYSNWVNNHGAHLPSPPQIVQYFSGPVPGSPGNYDDDYACYDTAGESPTSTHETPPRSLPWGASPALPAVAGDGLIHDPDVDMSALWHRAWLPSWWLRRSSPSPRLGRRPP